MDYSYPNEAGYYQEVADATYPFVQEQQMLSPLDYQQGMPPLLTDELPQLPPLIPSPQKPTRPKTRGAKPRAQARGPSRPKTPWTATQNRNLFRVMAEYIYVDKSGIKPLAIYLNPSELDHVEQCEMTLSMTDAEIAQSLCEQEIESNPNRSSHLLFGVLRHMQRASGDHGIRVVNEKVKNVRSRIVNWFMTMYAEGVLPSKRPVRYVAAMLNSIVTSPFCPIKDGSRFLATGVYAPTDNKHDVSLWLQAMSWLHPRRMYEFVVQCAIQIIRARLEGVPMVHRTNEDFHILQMDEPNMYVVVEQMRRLIGFLNDEIPASKSNSVSSTLKRKDGMGGSYDSFDYVDGGSSANGKKRKRKLNPQDSKKKARGANVMIVTNDDEQVSLAMFDLLKNEEKLQIAGMRVKVLAAVGGVIRNGSPNTRLDIKYHMYRLWTCVARLAEVNQMLVPVGKIPPVDAEGWPRFAEFVVVHDYYSPFSLSSIEPRIRVSKTRMWCKELHHSIEELVEQWVASTEGEARLEIPIWLTIARRTDGKYVLALAISSLDTAIPNTSGSAIPQSLLQYRKFTDDELLPIMDDAIASGGSGEIAGKAICSYGSMDPWPWNVSQTNAVDMSRGYVTHIKVDISGSSSQMIVASPYASNPDFVDPWMEPRIMASYVFGCQQDYANQEVIREAPLFEQILADEQARDMENKDSAEPSNAEEKDSGLWQPPQTQGHQPDQYRMPTISLTASDYPAITTQETTTLAPGDLTAGFSNTGNMPGISISAYPTDTSGYSDALYQTGDQRVLPPMLDTPGGLLMSSTQHLPVDMLGGYADNGWASNGFDSTSPYQHIFGNSTAPSEYGPP
ncbi:hypothetical protein GGF46_003732 [Coemansia sp. RSA 552]|nr:hypothetical protein GGF46_003732 [Coemansia sp. RSA 552]